MADSERLRMTSFMAEPSLLAQVDERAKRESRSRSWMLRHLIRTGLGERQLLEQVRPSALRPAITDTFPSPDALWSLGVRELKAEPFEGST